MIKKINLLALFFCTALYVQAAQLLNEPGLRAALTPTPSFQQAKSEARWDKQPETFLALGKIYYYGRGTKKDIKKARKYWQKAARQNQREAQLLLALLQLDSAKKEADKTPHFQTILKLAQEDYPLAQYALSFLYADGIGTPAQAKTALAWLQRAAQAATPVPAAQTQLALYYAQGYPPYIQPDLPQAFALMLRAAEAENPQARYNVAQMYLNGQGTEKNEKRAFHFMRLAAKDGLVSAQMELSDMYRRGTGVKTEDYQTFRWMHAAAVRGQLAAQEQTALNYLNGFGGPVNRREALFWAVQARAQGSHKAAEIIQKIKEP